METKCDDTIKLMRLKMERDSREEDQENEAESEDDGSKQDAHESLLQPLRNQGFSAFGAKPITCDVSKTAVVSNGPKHLDTASHVTPVAEQCDRAGNSALDLDVREHDFATAVGDAGASNCSSDADWPAQAGSIVLVAPV